MTTAQDTKTTLGQIIERLTVYRDKQTLLGEPKNLALTEILRDLRALLAVSSSVSEGRDTKRCVCGGAVAYGEDGDGAWWTCDRCDGTWTVAQIDPAVPASPPVPGEDWLAKAYERVGKLDELMASEVAVIQSMLDHGLRSLAARSAASTAGQDIAERLEQDAPPLPSWLAASSAGQEHIQQASFNCEICGGAAKCYGQRSPDNAVGFACDDCCSHGQEDGRCWCYPVPGIAVAALPAGQGQDATRAELLLESAWGIIANANNGDWDAATPEWKRAAERWRDNYFRDPARPPAPPPTPPSVSPIGPDVLAELAPAPCSITAGAKEGGGGR